MVRNEARKEERMNRFQREDSEWELIPGKMDSLKLRVDYEHTQAGIRQKQVTDTFQFLVIIETYVLNMP